MSSVKFNHTLHAFSAATVLALLMFVPQSGLADGRSGNVYVPTNQTTGNSIVVFHRDADGVLTFVGSVASGGNGAGTGADPLASQGAVVLSQDSRLLFAVNAGSDSISVFAVSGDRLDLLDTRFYDRPTNMPARALASANLPGCLETNPARPPVLEGKSN